MYLNITVNWNLAYNKYLFTIFKNEFHKTNTPASSYIFISGSQGK